MPPSPPDSAVLEAARRAFTRFGYAGATLERIAEEAGVNRVTLHRRGVSKDGLLTELVARSVEDYRQAMWPALTGTGTGAERLELALAALCDQAERHLGLLLAVRAQSDGIFHRDGDDDVSTRPVYTEPLEKVLHDGAVDGTLRVQDPAETATVLFNLVGWTYVHLRSGHGWDPDRARGSTLDLVLHGLVTVTAASPPAEGRPGR